MKLSYQKYNSIGQTEYIYHVPRSRISSMSLWMISWNYITLNLTESTFNSFLLQKCGKTNAIAENNVECMKHPVSLSYNENKNWLFFGKALTYVSFLWLDLSSRRCSSLTKKRKEKAEPALENSTLKTILFNVLSTSGLRLENASLKCFKFLLPNFLHLTLLN